MATEIHRITDGSPLYIDDLIRLARFYSIERAMNDWSGRHGDAAREYSLRKELEKLSKGAQAILGVLALADVPLSAEECAVIAGLSDEDAFASLNELTNWNLLSAPGLVEDVPRYSCSRNLAKLVRRTLAGSDQETRITNGLKGLKGLGVHSWRVRSFVRQAIALKESSRQDDAEAVLLKGLEEVPNSSEILAMLGWLHSKWLPRARIAEAEEDFKKAEALGHWNRNLYAHWADMYYGAREYTRAAAICDRAVKAHCKEDVFLWRLLGMANTHIGQLERQSLSTSNAAASFDRAARSLARAEQLSYSTPDLSRTFRALYDLSRAQAKYEEAEGVLARWEHVLPGDPYISAARSVSRAN